MSKIFQSSKEKYMENLYQQYCECINKPFDGNNLKKDYKDLSEWIVRNEEILRYYKAYIEYNGIIIDENTFEANKGRYDTMYDKKIQIVSPFSESIETDNGILIKKSCFQEFSDTVAIFDGKSSSKPLNMLNVSSVITQNPYSSVFLKPLDRIGNMGYSLCVGLYGDCADKDKLKKEKMLIDFSEKLENPELVYDTYNGNYYAAIISKPKIKKLVKNR